MKEAHRNPISFRLWENAEDTIREPESPLHTPHLPAPSTWLLSFQNRDTRLLLQATWLGIFAISEGLGMMEWVIPES